MGCFLCSPDPALVYAANAEAFALCGLGPLVRGYSIVATRAHVRSCADSATESPSLLEFTEQIRGFLGSIYGSCLVTEHGRLPVCARSEGSGGHCFHAHFLLFPRAPDIVNACRPYFGLAEATSGLGPTMALACGRQEYFLVAPTPTECWIMTRPLLLCRQFARRMVADRLGIPEEADWAMHPKANAAESEAEHLRRRVLTWATP